MQTFIKNIFDFVYSLYGYLQNYITQFQNDYFSFMSKNVFTENSLIGLNITYKEMLLYGLTWFLVIFFIVLFVKFIFKILGLFRFNRLND